MRRAMSMLVIVDHPMSGCALKITVHQTDVVKIVKTYVVRTSDSFFPYVALCG